MHECRGQTFSTSTTGQEDLSLRSCKGICLHKENKQTVMNDLKWKVWTRCTQTLTTFKNIFWGFHRSEAEDSCLLAGYTVSIGSYRRFESIKSRIDSATTKNATVVQSTCKDRCLL